MGGEIAELRAGQTLAGRYDVKRVLGAGGMGMVYKAFDRELGETVAIKVLRPDVARESGRVEQRFRSEIRLARRVRHRNVCSVYGDGEDRGLLYICMEHVEGENLARAARESGGLPTEAAWSATLQVADGLRAIHEVGVVHRDLKTANLMRDQKGIVRVMDFGIAKQHGTPGGVTVTATGTLMGTPEYMSPEQLRGDDVDFRTDLYSLGVVTYELFTGMLARLATPATLNGTVAFVTGLISSWSSTSGVVLPTFLPTVPGLVQKVGGGDPLAVALSINVGSAMVDVSPLSTLGALCVATVADPAEARTLFRQLLLWGLSMSIVGAVICQLLAGALARA